MKTEAEGLLAAKARYEANAMVPIDISQVILNKHFQSDIAWVFHFQPIYEEHEERLDGTPGPIIMDKVSLESYFVRGDISLFLKIYSAYKASGNQDWFIKFYGGESDAIRTRSKGHEEKIVKEYSAFVKGHQIIIEPKNGEDSVSIETKKVKLAGGLWIHFDDEDLAIPYFILMYDVDNWIGIALSVENSEIIESYLSQKFITYINTSSPDIYPFGSTIWGHRHKNHALVAYPIFDAFVSIDNNLKNRTLGIITPSTFSLSTTPEVRQLLTRRWFWW
ncbi:MAG: hypothetical protein AB8F95_04620 [Bacteroidia bacterium]